MKRGFLRTLLVCLLALCLLGNTALAAFAAPVGNTKKGDANNDGMVLANDAMLVLQYSVKAIPADRVNLAVCDMDGNGMILANDAMIILQYSVGMGPAEPEEPSVPETKLPKQVTVYGDDAVESYIFRYDEDQRLCGATYLEDGIHVADFTYTYDAAGRLLEVDHGEIWHWTGNDEYIYNDKGQLVCYKHNWSGGELPDEEWEYEYDENGVQIGGIYRIPATEPEDEYSATCTYAYVYDSEGRMIEKHMRWLRSESELEHDYECETEFGTCLWSELVTVTWYTYDSQGRVISESTADIPEKYCNPQGNPDVKQKEQTDYSYFGNFVVIQSDDYWPSSSIKIQDCMGETIWDSHLGYTTELFLEFDAEGCLVGIAGEDEILLVVSYDDADEEYKDESKQLKQINTYYASTLEEAYAEGPEYTTRFDYSYDGLLTSVTDISESNTTVRKNRYDEDDRLIEILLSTWGDADPMIKFHYDANGYLIRVSGIGEGGGVGGVYVNDHLGRPIKYSTEGDFFSGVIEYTYSDDGRTVYAVESWKDYEGNVSTEYITYTYSYDAEGRVVSLNRENSGHSQLITYRYDFKPFVAEAEVGKLPHLYSINDVMGHEIWALHTGVPKSVETDEDGYITRIVFVDHDPTVTNGVVYRDDAIYEFFYE